MPEPADPAPVRNKAMDLLARREHSAQELRDKLKLRDYDPEDIEAALDRLQRDGLQSDSRFAEAYVHHRVGAGFGPARIRHELRQRGVADAIVDEYLEPLADSWDELMSQQRERHFGKPLPPDYRARMKQARYLQNRGFSPESVMRLFR